MLVYGNAAYPSVMKSIDIKLKEFTETIVLQEREKFNFVKLMTLKVLHHRVVKPIILNVELIVFI